MGLLNEAFKKAVERSGDLGYVRCPFCGRKIIGVGVICKCELNADTEGCEEDSRDID